MNIITLPIRLLWRRSETQAQTQAQIQPQIQPQMQPQMQPQTHSYILQLPLEILLEIFAFLPSHSQLLVYQTCRPLRKIIHQYFLAGKGETLITLNDRLNYLTHLVRSRPDRWVCAKCCKLHQTCSRDTPSTRASYKCGDGKINDFKEPSECKVFYNYGYSPSHRHVELTLKYTRLESQKKTHQEYLQRLLTPHHVERRKLCINIAGGILEQCSYYPKVVDGRYLLFTVRTYVGIGTTVSRQSMGFIRICPHLSSFAEIRTRNGLKLDLDMILRSAFSAPPKTRVFFPCLGCGTDVSVQISPKRAIVCAWQDLGPEGTVCDLEWEAIVRETSNKWHEAGTIRELYGQHEHNDDIL